MKPVYRMSSAGYCPKKLGAMRLGLECESAPKWLETSAEEGKWHEARVKQELEGEYALLSEQDELVLEYPTFILVGHIDGRIIKDGAERLLEVKSMSQYEFDRWMKNNKLEAFPQYASQLACYFEGTGLSDCLYVVKNRNNGYVDKNIFKAEDFVAEFQMVLSKLRTVEELAQHKKLAELDFNPDSLECKRCAYKKFCAPEPKVLDIVTETFLKQAIEQVREGKKLEQEGKDLYDKGKEVLKAYTYSSGQRKWSYDNLAVCLIKVRDTVTYPKEAIEAKVPEDILREIAVQKSGYEYLKIEDLEKE